MPGQHGTIEIAARPAPLVIEIARVATTSVCVDSTVRDAMFRDFTCLVIEDCTAEPIGADEARSNLTASLAVLELLFAWITDSAAVMDALRDASPAIPA